MARNYPRDEGPFPERQQATWRALEHAIVPSESLTHRISSNGDNYHVSKIFDITTAQGSAYFYIDNTMSDELFALVSDKIKVSGGNAEVYVYDEPTLDENTFQSYEFRNVRSDVTPGPDQNAYFGYDSDVTISDNGRIYDEDYIKASQGSPGGTQTGAGSNGSIGYIIGPSSDALLEIRNVSSDTIEVAVSAFFHEIPTVPDLRE